MSNESLTLAFKQFVNGTTIDFVNGSVAAPGLAFVDNLSTGLSMPTTNELVVSANSVETTRLTATDVRFPLPVSLIDHVGISPSIATLGYMYKKSGDDSIYWNTQGTGEINLVTDHALSTLATDSVGAIATPSYSFSADADTGMYLSAVGILALAIGGVNALKLTDDNIAIGSLAGLTAQGLYSSAIGYESGTIQNAYAISIGWRAGYTLQAVNSISIGGNANYNGGSSGSISIGSNTGYTDVGINSIGIGLDAARTGQLGNCISVGREAGYVDQGQYALAIGSFAGRNTQGDYAIAVGASSGFTTQGDYAIALSNIAAFTNQGDYAVAIGYRAGVTNQGANSIIINSSGVALDNTGTNRLTIAPIRNENTPLTALVYNTTTKEVSYSTSGTKTFIVDHPNDDSKYLVHACLEGPEAGVYYHGISSIPINSTSVFVPLPAYTSTWTDWTIFMDAIGTVPNIFSFELSNTNLHGFTVYGKFSGQFSWRAFAKRSSIDVEPNRDDVVLSGNAPYKTLEYL